MKLAKKKLSALDAVCQALDKSKIVYMRAGVEAKDQIDGKSIQTEVILFGAVFSKTTGDYLFAAPVLNPFAKPNSKQ